MSARFTIVVCVCACGNSVEIFLVLELDCETTGAGVWVDDVGPCLKKDIIELRIEASLDNPPAEVLNN